MTKNQTKIIVRDVNIDALLGFYPQEIGIKQRVTVNVEATLSDYRIDTDNITSTVSYAPVMEEIIRISNIQFSLAEKFAEHLANFCLAYERIESVKVRVEKLDIFAEGIVGTEIIRTK